MYLVPFKMGSPSCKCVSLPGCMKLHPFLGDSMEQLYLRNLHPPPCGKNTNTIKPQTFTWCFNEFLFIYTLVQIICYC